jgi:hypothetical protein
MPRTVVLRHTLPDGSAHFDWLIESAAPPAPADPDARTLTAWRVEGPLHEPHDGPAGWPARRLPPHRRLYLDYEGPVSGNRGHVVRMARGSAEVLTDAPARYEAILRLETHAARITIEPEGPGAWRLSAEPL